MNELIEMLNRRRVLLEKAIRLADKEEKTFPDGSLRVSRSPRQTRYYQMIDGFGRVGKYLPKKELSTIRRLAQKDYNRLFRKTAENELKELKKFILKYNATAEDVYTNLIPERTALVKPYILPDDLIAKEWQSKIFKTNPYKPENKIFDTRKGERVRSKSEAIIADTLYELGIPYFYEYPLKLSNGVIRYPDFMLLKVSTKEVIYFEHFGCLDDEVYRKETLEKLNLYGANGIFPGKNLIFTYETKDSPLDINGLRKMLIELFL